MKNLLFVLISLLAITKLQAQKLNFKTGGEFTITTHTTQTTVDTHKLLGDEAYTFQFKVLDNNEAAYRLQCTLLKVKQWHKGSPANLNSDSIRLTSMNSTAVLTPLSILQKDFTVILNPRSKLLRIEGTDELITQTNNTWHLKGEIQQYRKANLDTLLLPILKKMFFELPGQNIVRGLQKNALVTYNLTKAGAAQLCNYSQSVKSGKGTAALADTAWANMAVLFSYWSDAFNTKTMRVDSARVFGYFGGHDALYKNDAYYNAHKLSLIEYLDSPNADIMYSHMLTKTPNVFLKDNAVHLANKLQNMLSINADSAYNVIKYLYKYPDFNDCLQLYARGFIDGNDANSLELLNLLNADKSMGLQPQIKALSLWVSTKNSAGKLDVLLNSYNSFMQMNDVYMMQGNGARYALLIYKMLVDAKKDEEADRLLSKTTQNLERYAIDTANQLRYADEKILAYAYYLKYQSINKTDSAMALQYLAKAAQHSTTKKYRPTLSTLSDPLFLGSKTSYRDEYMDQLFAHGDNETALKLFAAHINADPSRLQDMETLYQTKFEGKRFKDFFMSNVISTWPDAPDFKLAGLNGESHMLSDYKGKWLILDFWGTWCAPCRKEMPKVNDFNNELTTGKYAGITLLGIACNDNAIAVKKYLTENKLGITVAMGDSLISTNYKIKEYPSKILISPNGKMIETSSDADWQGVIRKLNELYVAD